VEPEYLAQQSSFTVGDLFPGLTAVWNSSCTPDTHQLLVVILQLFADLSIRLVCTGPVLDTSGCEGQQIERSAFVQLRITRVGCSSL